MKVTVHLGEPFWRIINTHEVGLLLRDNATVSDACVTLTRLYPAMQADLNSSEVQPLIFVNDDQADRSTPLIDGAKLYLLFPVSGG
ncbi:MAG TPA: MoaD/ThiS family protein [Anaerolineae bacterium]|nr:MoaD/ThiS family protein [Anaerolineae bacterium]